MKTLTWLHISDIHSCPAHTGWDASHILDKLKDDLTRLKADHGLVPDIIFVTGDIMYGAKTECGDIAGQYDAAHSFLMGLKEISGVDAENLFLVPGNHDVNTKVILQSQIDWLAKQEITQIEDMLQHGNNEWPGIMKRLEAYRTFLANKGGVSHLLSDPSRLIYSHKRTINNIKTGIVGLNTAWSSCGKGEDEKGHLWFGGAWQIKTLLKELAECDIKIALSHHPFDWQNASEGPNVRHLLQDSFHFHLHGHEHQGWVEPLEDSHHCRIAAGAVYVRKDKAKQTGYNIVRIDFENQQCEIWFRRYEESGAGGWVTQEIPGKTDALGRKTISLNKLLPAKAATCVMETEVVPQNISIEPKGANYDPRKYYFHVPYSQKGDQVIGRAEALNAVREQLTKGHRTSIGQTAAFQGLGGLGKTQLAVEYAYQYKDEYPNGVIWINADQDIDAQLTELAEKACWIAPASEHKFKLEIAKQRVRSYSDCLVIFDNLVHNKDIKDYLPEPTARPHILITSRIEQPGFTPVPLDPLDEDLSLKLLIQESGREPKEPSEVEAARNIAKKLGGLPLALELVGAYLRHRANTGWSQYFDLLDKNIKAALPKKFLEGSFTKHEADLYSTLKINEEVFEEEPILKEMLDLLTWSGPASMGLSIMCRLLDVNNTSLLTNALGLGTSLRLLQKTPGEDRYSLHRLVSEVRREEIPLGERREWVNVVCTRLGDWLEEIREQFIDLPLFEAEIDHLRAWQENSIVFAPEHTSRLMWLHSYPPYHRGDYKAADEFIEKALVLFEKKNNADEALRAHLLNDLGVTQPLLGNFQHQLEYTEKALKIRIDIFGERHPETALSLNNVGGAYAYKGDYDRALKYHERALKIRIDLFGERHPDTAQSMNNVGTAYGNKGDYNRALEYQEGALKIHMDLFGERHPDTARSLNNVGTTYGKKGDYDRSLEYHEMALKIHMDLFGERHPDTARSLNNVGTAYAEKGDYDRALEYQERALISQMDLFGERHPDTARSLDNVGTAYAEKGDYDRALEYQERALITQMDLFGERHPDTARSLNNVGTAYGEKGDYDRELEYYERALKIYMDLFGERHPDTATSLNNVGYVYYKKGINTLAADKFGNALKVYRELLGDKHAKTISCSINLLRVLFDLKRHPQALRIINEFLSSLSTNHPSYDQFLQFKARIPGFRKQSKSSKKIKRR